MKLPTGSGVPASDGAAVIAQATSACRAINTITLEMSVHGSEDGRRLRGRLSVGFARPASARLEAVASFGPPVFVFVSTDDDASLVLPRDKRILEHGTPADVLEAVTGVPLDAAMLRTVVTGCAAAPDEADVIAIGDSWRVAPDGGDNVYFRRDGTSSAWRLVARVHRSAQLTVAWRAEYAMFDNGLARAIHLVSQPADRFDLQLDLSQVDTNVTLGPEVFRQTPAAGDTPITLDELRQSGPLGER